MANGQYDDEMKGVLFKNKDKQPGDNRPDYKGKLQIGGNVIYQSGWLRKSNKTGETFMSISYELPRQNTQGAAPAPQQAQPVQAAPVVPTPDDEIPF